MRFLLRPHLGLGFLWLPFLAGLFLLTFYGAVEACLFGWQSRVFFVDLCSRPPPSLFPSPSPHLVLG